MIVYTDGVSKVFPVASVTSVFRKIKKCVNVIANTFRLFKVLVSAAKCAEATGKKKKDREKFPLFLMYSKDFSHITTPKSEINTFDFALQFVSSHRSFYFYFPPHQCFTFLILQPCHVHLNGFLMACRLTLVLFTFLTPTMCKFTDQGSDAGRLTPQIRKPTPDREVTTPLTLLCCYIRL